MNRRYIIGVFVPAFFFVFLWLFIPAPSDFRVQNVTVIGATDLGFVPNEITIRQGETVLFKNSGALSHWPASNFHPTHAQYPDSDVRLCNSALDAFIFDACEAVPSGGVYSFAFHEAGDWKFHDHLRPRYSGRIIVEEIPGYRKPLRSAVKFELAKLIQNTSRIFTGERRIIPGLSLTQRDASGLLIGTAISADDLKSSKDYESEPIYHYVYDDIEIRKVLFQLGARRTMDKILTESQGGSAFDCHIGAHYVGRAAYDLFGKEAIGEGNAACHSGYYHGVMEGLFWDVGSSGVAEKVSAMCRDFSDEFSVQQCFHGSGHGILAMTGYDLPAAITWCDKAARDDKKTSCYGGVFMENVMTAVGLSAGINDHTTDWLSFDDLQYPCNTLSDNPSAQKICYEMQTSWMLAVLSFDYEKVIAVCNDVPEGNAEACFTSIGRDVGGTTLRNAKKTETLCAMVPEKYFSTCIVGTVNTVIDFWGPNLGEEGIAFCGAFEREDARRICYARIVERVPDLFSQPARRTDFCALLPAGYVDDCLNTASK